MTKKKSDLSAHEEQLILALRQHPELMERFRAILELTDSKDGVAIKTADEIEALLIDEVRRLGRTAMTDWVVSAEMRLGEQLAKNDTSAGVRKKKR
jgi:DNA polymerase II large subunit